MTPAQYLEELKKLNATTDQILSYYQSVRLNMDKKSMLRFLESVEKMKLALEFYAVGKHLSAHEVIDDDGFPSLEPIDIDNEGDMAREALAAFKGDG